jgi:hypothetical protein
MPGEWFRAARLTAFVGLLRDEDPTRGMSGLDKVLSDAGVLSRIGPLLDYYTIKEPYHVGLQDLGISANATARILVLETTAIQVNGGLNEIPQGVCTLAVGRDMAAVASGVNDANASSIAHVLEQYLSTQIPARIYVKAQTTYFSGVGDAGDNDQEANEWLVLLDGFAAGPTRRGSPENAEFALHLSHFLAGLNFSSSLSGSAAAGSSPEAFSTAVFPTFLGGSGIPATVFGAVSATIATSAYTDFWGYNIPETQTVIPAMGLKGFLANLASADIFNWQNTRKIGIGGSFCKPGIPNTARNDRALFALNKLEPIWPAGGFPDGAWTGLYAAINGLRGGTGRGIHRAQILNQAAAVGYRYGMPIALNLDDAKLNVLMAGRGFGEDVASATFADLAPASFWELLVGRYSGRYQLAVAPMADRAVVVPVQPLLDAPWQIIYASEIWQWNDDFQVPVPVRGVILGGERSGGGGSGAGYNFTEAGYDSCEAGVFIFRDMPNWLISSYIYPGITSTNTLQTSPRAAAAAPWATAVLAQLGINLGSYNALGGVLGGAALAAAEEAILAAQPGQAKKTTANQLAQAYWQQEKLRYRSVFVTGRFRTDIAPGSAIVIEVPADKYVQAAINGGKNTTISGFVLRVTHSIDSVGESASTSLQLGFVRTLGETQPGQPLFANRHPFWTTVTRGLPWCDSRAMRAKLGGESDLLP